MYAALVHNANVGLLGLPLGSQINHVIFICLDIVLDREGEFPSSLNTGVVVPSTLLVDCPKAMAITRGCGLPTSVALAVGTTPALAA